MTPTLKCTFETHLEAGYGNTPPLSNKGFSILKEKRISESERIVDERAASCSVNKIRVGRQTFLHPETIQKKVVNIAH
jgi:hypothetical protein